MPDWLYLLLTVPAVSAFIGWLTNWQAVKMIFWPARFIGIGSIGWQGILYRHADTFATNLGQIAKDDLMSGSDIVQRIDLDEIERIARPIVDADLTRFAAEGAEVLRPGAWAMVPPPMQAMVAAQLGTKVTALAREVVGELREELTSLLDVQELVRRQLSGANVDRLSRLTFEIGKREFKFIEWSGAVFGAIIGFGQLTVWSAMQIWWLMPLFGIAVGLATNWLALQMIFRPHERTRYLSVLPYQGLFPRRQPEIARDYARSTSEEVLTPHHIIDFLIEGERGAALLDRIRAAISTRVDAEWRQLQPMVPFPVEPAAIAQLKEMVLARLIELAPRLRPAIEQHLHERLDIRRTVEQRLGSLPKPEFERMLRGVFQKNELTLILVGGVLGGLVGCIQAVLVLAD